jgi:Rap1a immunity proteins
MRRILAAAAAFAALAGPSIAADSEDYLLETAGDLAALCAAPADASAIHMCQGFMVGAHRVFGTIGHALGDPLYCLPTDGSVSRDTAARDFAAWATASPEVASMSPSDGLLRWARTAFPCS